MSTELRSPFGAGSVEVPDDLVDKYRAEGWAVIDSDDGEDDKSDEPEPAEKPKRPARSTRTHK